MTYQEALDGIVDALPNIENFDEHISVLKGAKNLAEKAEKTEFWENKYKDLATKYKQRFKDASSIKQESQSGGNIVRNEERYEGNRIRFSDIDFNAKTE